MSVIKIRGRADPIFLPYEQAKWIKQRKFGDDTVNPPIPKALPSDLLDLGDQWSGTYGQINSIELNDKPQAPRIAEEAIVMTPQIRKMQREFFENTAKELPFLNNKKTQEKMALTRSGLIEYKNNTGKDFVVPEGTEIIEDVK